MSNILDLQQQLEQARQREAAARAAEQQRMEDEQAHQRAAAQAAQEAAVFEAQIAAADLLEQVNNLALQVDEVQQFADTIASGLNSLKAAISGQSSEFPVQKVLGDLSSFDAAQNAYFRAYGQLYEAVRRARQAHPAGDFRDVDNAFLLLKRPNESRNAQTLLIEWMGSQTPSDPLGRPMSVPADVDGLLALIVALLDNGGRVAVRKFFNFK